VNDFGGIISIHDAAKELGYTIKEGSSVSGSIYKRLEDLSYFGLFTRDRGGLKVTQLGMDAFDAIDKLKADNAKADAIRKITIIAKAFDEWNGEVPEFNAIPAKISTIVGINWVECKKHAGNLQKLFNETFPYLTLTDEYSPPKEESKDEGVISISTEQILDPKKPSIMKGELRTSIGSIIITNKSQVKLARSLLDVFEEELENQSNSTVEGEETAK
jgi:hypothetical protein